MSSSRQSVNLLPDGKNSQPSPLTSPRRATSSRESNSQSNVPRGTSRPTVYGSHQPIRPDAPQQPVPRQIIPCPYHGLILQMEPLNYQRGYSVMERFMEHNPSQQYSLFHDSNGELSTRRRCTCINSVDVDFNRAGIGADEYKDLNRNNLSGFNFGL